MSRSFRFFFLGFFGLATSAPAATLTWPGVAPCDTTLQICVNAAAVNDTVQIGSGAGEITTALAITKPMTLRSAPFARARFRDTSLFLTANFAGPGNRYVVEGIQFINAPIDVSMGTTEFLDEQTVVLRGLDITSLESFDPAIRIATPQISSRKLLQIQHLRFLGRTGIGNLSAGPVLDLEVDDSQFTLTGLSGAVRLGLQGVSNATIRRNRFEDQSGKSEACVNLQHAVGGTGTFEITRNVLVGCPTGLRLYGAPGIGNTLVRLRNNTLRRHLRAAQFASPVLAAEVDNNIFSDISTIVFDQELSSLTIRNNLYHRTPPIPQEQIDPVFGDPRFVSGADLHLDPMSPASGAAFAPSVPAGGDFDGHSADPPSIGAFEFRFGGSGVHVAAPDNSFSNVTVIPESLSRWFTQVNVQSIVENFPLPTWAPNHLGVYSTESAPLTTRVFAQNQMAIGTPRRFNVLDSSLYARSQQIASLSNVSANVLVMDAPDLNGNPFARPIVMQRARQTGGVLNDRAIGVWYNIAIGRWTIFNQDQAPMPIGAEFDVLIPPLLSSNAFIATASASPTIDLLLDHPLLDNQPCATVFAIPVFTGTYLPSAIHARYRPTTNGGGRWTLIRGDGDLFQNGMDFHVVVEPSRARWCQADALFLDGLE